VFRQPVPTPPAMTHETFVRGSKRISSPVAFAVM
jgi:hypothetical protein